LIPFIVNYYLINHLNHIKFYIMKTILLNTKFQIILVLISILFISCDKENTPINVENNTLKIEDYFELMKTNFDGGKVLLQSNTSIGYDEQSGIQSLQSSLDVNTKKNHYFEIVDQSTGKKINSKDSNYNSKDLFGKKLTYKIGEENSKGSESEVYIPQLIVAEVDSDKLKEGTIITWNIDQLNENGIIVWYEYKPYEQDTYNVIDNNRKAFSNGFTLEDSSGSYVIKESDLSLLPNNARITFYVARAGFDISQNTEDNEIGFVGITTSSKDLRVEK